MVAITVLNLNDKKREVVGINLGDHTLIDNTSKIYEM